MNWLAHIFISKNSIDYQLGNLLADPLKGKTWEGASVEIEEGFRMHVSIDRFTDANEFVLKSKSRLESGHLKGVVVDVVYDYLLTRNWNQFSNMGLESFVSEFHDNAQTAIKSYPYDARKFVERLVQSGNLLGYGSLEGLEFAFRRIDTRLSARILSKESATEYLPALKREMAGIEEDFFQFFPQLVEHFKSEIDTSLQGHWLK